MNTFSLLEFSKKNLLHARKPGCWITKKPVLWIGGFDDQKFKKIQLKIFFTAFLLNKLQFSHPQASIKDAQMYNLQEKPSVLKREHPALQNMKYINCFLFSGPFLPSWIRIRIWIQGPHWIQIQSGSGSTTMKKFSCFGWQACEIKQKNYAGIFEHAVLLFIFCKMLCSLF